MQEDTNVIKHLTKLANDSDEYTAKLQLNTAEGEAYKTRLNIGNILKVFCILSYRLQHNIFFFWH
jgi:hypothetical protein